MVKKKANFFERVEGEVVGAAGSYFKETVQRKLLKIGEFSVLMFLAFLLISFGIANMIGFYYPQFNNGLNFVFLGMVYLIAGFLIRF
jgi:uncharacterized membrane protein HdeD (DUF308 family)